MITTTTLNMKNNQEESIQGTLLGFPYSSIYGEMENYVGGYIPWHWHKALEICYIIQGEVTFFIQNEKFNLQAGEAILVNTSRLHMAKPVSNGCKVIFHVLIFDKSIISGQYGSIYDNKYVTPLLECSVITGIKFQLGNKNQEQIISGICDAYALSEKEEFGYEVKIRNLLSETWLLILLETKEKIKTGKVKEDVNSERIKCMLHFIQQNYKNKLELKDIAYAASISKRECLRCFKKSLQITPFEYLIQYRISAAADMLTNTDKSVMNISEACGFSTSSYFSKTFKIMIKCTPKEYRNKNNLSV